MYIKYTYANVYKIYEYIYKMNIAVQSLVPTYTFASNTMTTSGNQFAARPLKHWRKQLQATNGLLSYRRTSIGMPMDRPGSSNTTSYSNCQQCNGGQELKELVNKNSAGASFCPTCKIKRTSISLANISVANISGANISVANISGTETHNQTFTDSASYLQSKGVTYDQTLTFNPVPGITYFSANGIPREPTNSPTGSQVRETNPVYGGNNCLIYKPNNSQFAQQGGVAAGTRIARLKYNTLNNYGAEYNSSAGAVGVNTGRYVTEPSPAYYTKLKPQKFTYHPKVGAPTYCPTRYSMCMQE